MHILGGKADLKPVGGGTGVTSGGGTLGGVGATNSRSTLVVLVRVFRVLVRVGVDTSGLGLEFIEGDGGEGGHFVDN
jgi:hypothetical protein